MVRLDKIKDLAKQFVLVRLDKITGIDLNVFQFDYDMTWMGFFLSADERVYGRYGGKDNQAENHLSISGLRHAMQSALARHKKRIVIQTARKPQRPLLAENIPGAKLRRRGECIHCHQVNEYTREARKQSGLWTKDEVWVYPWPENIGLTLDRSREDRIKAVAAGSAAARAGLKTGDILNRLNAVSIASFADVQFALNNAQAQGKITAAWQRNGKAMTGAIDLEKGWKKTNLTWRPSMLYILPSLTMYGDDLTATEKKALGLPAKRLAFRQESKVHPEAQKMGIQAGDIIIGLNQIPMKMTRSRFFAHVRQNYFVGEKISLDVIRNGKKLKLPVVLK